MENLNHSLRINWKFQPAIVNASLANLTNNNTTLFLPMGALAIGTKYTFSVTVTSLLYPIVTLTKTLAFSTGSPPIGGSAYMTPDAGFVNLTEFTVGISNWKSVN